MVPFNQTRRQPTRREADSLPHQVATYRNRNFSHWRLQRPWLSLWESCQPNRLTERVLRLMVWGRVLERGTLSVYPFRGSQLSQRESQGRFAPYYVQHNTIHRNTLAAFVACVAYLANLVFRVVLQDSPGARMAAAGFFSQSWVPFSLLGMLCHGSMHTNCGIPRLLQIRV